MRRRPTLSAQEDQTTVIANNYNSNLHHPLIQWISDSVNTTEQHHTRPGRLKTDHRVVVPSERGASARQKFILVFIFRPPNSRRTYLF